jgi:small-conductance mechanosensitive channel
MTIRSTVLMTLQGNQVQIPNSAVYKATILNFTSTPNRREEFLLGIGYEVPIPFAQEVALKVLAEHPAVLTEPEPWVLVDGLSPASVNLRVYFWLNGHEHSWLKVRSAVIRLVKRAFQEQGVTMPDEARERVFLHEIPVRLIDSKSPQTLRPAAPETNATIAEGGLISDAAELEQQAAQSQLPDVGENLLKNS